MAEGGSHGAELVEAPCARFSLGISGHREGNADFARNRPDISAALERTFAIVDRVATAHEATPEATRLVSPLAHGADTIAAHIAVERGWKLVAPLPLGFSLNLALNLNGASAEDVLALVEGRPLSAASQALAAEMRELADRAELLELADEDARVADLLGRTLRDPGATESMRQLDALVGERTAAASRVVVEQSDLVVAVWDGSSPGVMGGTRHTMALALGLGVPVLWIDASDPTYWALFELPEQLSAPRDAMCRTDEAAFETWLAGRFADPSAPGGYHAEVWRSTSWRLFHLYRWIERTCGKAPGGTDVNEEEQAERQELAMAQRMRALPGLPESFAVAVEAQILHRFEWADAVSTSLSDTYRGGMVLNFVLSAAAVLTGVAYLPLTGGETKWPFALVEFVLLLAIVLNTIVGRKRRWHSRWFQTRRVAEYLRHAPMLLLLGIGRPPASWPRGKDSSWPEDYARCALEEVGLPPVAISEPYLRAVVNDFLLAHAREQEEYHRAKAERLTRVHRRLDRLSDLSFKLAVSLVAAFLLLQAADALGVVPSTWPHDMSKLSTFFGVALPTLGGMLAGIRYFGDFERFAAISEVTSEKLAEIRRRIEHLLSDATTPIRYPQAADLANGIDAIVTSEIENWQAVFASKGISVPA